MTFGQTPYDDIQRNSIQSLFTFKAASSFDPFLINVSTALKGIQFYFLFSSSCKLSMSRGYKTFFMLSSDETKILTAHNY